MEVNTLTEPVRRYQDIGAKGAVEDRHHDVRLMGEKDLDHLVPSHKGGLGRSVDGIRCTHDVSTAPPRSRYQRGIRLRHRSSQHRSR
jgi:hypothetical protein